MANFTRYEGDLGAALLLGAIAFAGAGGANNLCQSNYVRHKNMGMGANIPNIVSTVSGVESASAAQDRRFRGRPPAPRYRPSHAGRTTCAGSVSATEATTTVTV